METPMLNLRTAYRDTLGACLATRWQLIGFLVLFSLLSGFIWASYFELASMILRQAETQAHDADMITSVWGRKPLGALIFTTVVTTISLTLLTNIDDGRKSIWAPLKRLFRRWQALLTVSLAFALLSIANVHAITNLGNLQLAHILVDIIIYVLKYLCLLALLSAVAMERTLPAQISSLLNAAKSTWLKMLAQLLLLAIFFKLFAFAYGLVENQIFYGYASQLYRIPLFIADTVVSYIVPAIVFATLVHANWQSAARRKSVAELFS